MKYAQITVLKCLNQVVDKLKWSCKLILDMKDKY